MYQVLISIYCQSLLDLNHIETDLDNKVFPDFNKNHIVYTHQIFDL